MRFEALFTLLFVGVVSAQAQDQLHGTENRPALELKGIKLGDDLSTVQKALPNAKCEVLKDPSLGDCWQGKDMTLGGKPAQLLVRLLEGRVVYVLATRMTQEDAYAVIDGLKGKYGEPDRVTNTRVTLVRPARDRSLVYERPTWTSDGGNHELTIQPANFTDKREQFTYAAVSLVDLKGHNTIWMSRFRSDTDVGDLTSATTRTRSR